MSTIPTFSSSVVFLVQVMRSEEPRETLEKSLVALLKVRLKEWEVLWNPSNFCEGLRNPDMPVELLQKLEDLLLTSEKLQWDLPKTLVEDLDLVVEDIESFNPAYIARVECDAAKVERDREEGKLIPLSELSKEL